MKEQEQAPSELVLRTVVTGTHFPAASARLIELVSKALKSPKNFSAQNLQTAPGRSCYDRSIKRFQEWRSTSVSDQTPQIPRNVTNILDAFCELSYRNIVTNKSLKKLKDVIKFQNGPREATRLLFAKAYERKWVFPTDWTGESSFERSRRALWSIMIKTQCKATHLKCTRSGFKIPRMMLDTIYLRVKPKSREKPLKNSSHSIFRHYLATLFSTLRAAIELEYSYSIERFCLFVMTYRVTKRQVWLPKLFNKLTARSLENLSFNINVVLAIFCREVLIGCRGIIN